MNGEYLNKTHHNKTTIIKRTPVPTFVVKEFGTPPILYCPRLFHNAKKQTTLSQIIIKQQNIKPMIAITLSSRKKAQFNYWAFSQISMGCLQDLLIAAFQLDRQFEPSQLAC